MRSQASRLIFKLLQPSSWAPRCCIMPSIFSLQYAKAGPPSAFANKLSEPTSSSPPAAAEAESGKRSRGGPVMAKRFRLRISWVIPSFRSCRSKDGAGAADSPVFPVSPVNSKAFDVDFPHPRASPLPGKLCRPHVPIVPSGCRCGSAGSDRAHQDSSLDVESGGVSGIPPAYLWRKEEKWHVVACVGASSPRRKIDSDEGGRELFPPLPIRRQRRRQMAMGKKKKGRSKRKCRPRVSTSSADSHWFSSEEEYLEDYDYDDETEMLMSSSRSFSTECSSSSEVNPRLKPINESPDGQQQKETAAHPHTAQQAALHGRARMKRGGSTSRALYPSPEESSSPSEMGGTASSVLRRLMMTPLCGVAVEGKVRESFAVVKRSDDPYGDFRRSMAEMVVEKEMYEERDLEQLLRYFLLLNSHHHHPAILRAFSDVWATLFPCSHSCTSAAATPPPAVVIS